MSFLDAMGAGGGTSRFDTHHGRSPTGQFHGSLRYPSPFFDIGQTFLPSTFDQLFKWCRYYFMVNPLINAVTYKMAEYPITPLIFEIEDVATRKKWESISETQLKLRAFQVEVGLDYFCYGNAFITIHFPFIKKLICTGCKNEVNISQASYKFKNLKYHMFCDKCKETTEAKVFDHYIRDLKGIKLIRWNPEYVRPEHNDLTGKTDYFFTIPQTVRNDILMGKRHIVETIPKIYIEALQQSKTVRFNDEHVFHLKRPTIAQKDMGWGMPLILPVLKDTYYLQILRKAQEAIAQQHIVPLRILFPNTGSASADPYSTTDLGMWRKRIEAEIQKWRADANYIPILPLPIGHESIGGEGRALMLHQEMRAWSEQIVAGMHVPIEFVFGGLQYSGSNVSMRMLENQFLGYRLEQHVLVNDFILGRIADYMGWPRPQTRFKRFKMADDLQRSALVFQLNQAMKISDTTLLDDMDYDIVQEEKFKKVEMGKQMENQRRMQLAAAQLQGEVQVVQAKFQIIAQRLMQQMGVDPAQAAGGQGGEAGDQYNQAIKQFGEQQMQGMETDPNQAQQPMSNMPSSGAGTQQPLEGEQVAPGVPEGVTVYPENAQDTPERGIPVEMQSPLTMAAQQGGLDALAVARRVSTFLEQQDELTRQAHLQKMKGLNPQLYTLVNQMISSGRGSQANPLDPLQSPLPEQKPPRRPDSII